MIATNSRRKARIYTGPSELVVFEFRHALKGVLGGTAHYCVIWIPLLVTGARGPRSGSRRTRGAVPRSRCGWSRCSGGRGGHRGRTNGFIHELELVRGNEDLVLSQAKKTTDTNDIASRLTGLIDQDFIDVAEFLILIIVDIETDKLGSPPLTGSRHRGRRRSLRRRR
jgi:hypothetical protein